jgi:hypothetical protein
MRTISAAVACIALIAGVGGLRADVIDRGPSGAEALTTSPATFRNMVPGADGTRQTPYAGRSAAGFDNPYGPAKAREIRLAQLGTSTAPVETYSGNPSQAPYKWVGLLQIPNPTQQHPNQTLDCTAQFITPSVILTAGHCLRDLPANPAGPWPDPNKGQFILQYQNGGGRVFKVLCAAANPLWTLPSNYASMKPAEQQAALMTAWPHDFAMIQVEGASPTGVMPYAVDWKGKAGTTYAYRVGYPANILDAEIVQATPGIVFFADAIPFGEESSPNLVVQWGPVTDATQGMSGGAWVVNPDVNEGANHNILIAVTSFNVTNSHNLAVYPGGFFAAYLTSTEFYPLLAFVENGCK